MTTICLCFLFTQDQLFKICLYFPRISFFSVITLARYFCWVCVSLTLIATRWPVSHLPPPYTSLPSSPSLCFPLRLLYLRSFICQSSTSLATPVLLPFFFLKPILLIFFPLLFPSSAPSHYPFLQHLLVCVRHCWPVFATCLVLVSVSHRDPKSLPLTHKHRSGLWWVAVSRPQRARKAHKFNLWLQTLITSLYHLSIKCLIKAKSFNKMGLDIMCRESQLI